MSSSSSHPRTPPRRKFGTVLSANSTPPKSAKKAAIVRKSRSCGNWGQPDQVNDGAVAPPGSGEDGLFASFTVQFAAGPIGLQLEPGSHRACVVQRIVPDGVASRHNIQAGDCIHKVNGQVVTTYDQAIGWLKVGATRNIEFVRHFSSTDAHAEDASTPPHAVADGSSATDQKELRKGRAPSTTKKIRGKAHSVPGVVKRIIVAPPSPPAAGSPSSTSTFETKNNPSRMVTMTPPPTQRATPPPPRSRSMDPPSSTRSSTDPSAPRLDLTRETLGCGAPSPAHSASPTAPRRSSFFGVLAPKQWRAPATAPPTTSSAKSSSSPGTEPQLRVLELQAELQQERENTKILQQDKIELHRCRRELEVWQDQAHQLTDQTDDLRRQLLQLQQQQQVHPELSDVPRSHERVTHEVQEQLEASRRDLSHARAELEELRLQLQSQRDELLQQHESEREQWNAQVDRLRVELEAEQQARSQAQARLESDLQAQRDNETGQWRAQIEDLRGELERERQLQSQTLDEKTGELNKQRAEKEQLSAQRDELQITLERLSQELRQAKSQHQVELEQNQSKYQQLQVELGRLRATMESQAQQWNQATEAHEGEVQALLSERDRLQAELVDLRGISDRQSQQLRQTKDRHGAELDLVLAEKERLRRELEILRNDLQNQKQQLDPTISRLETELDAARREKKQFQDLLEESRQCQEQQMNRVEACYEVELETVQLENERLLAQLCELKASVDFKDADDSAGFLAELREKNLEVHQLRQQTIALQMTVNDLESQLKVKETAFQVATLTVQEMQATKSNYASDVTRLTSIVDEMAAEKLRLQEKLYLTQDKLALSTEQQAAKAKALESDRDILREKVQSLTQDLQIAQDKSLNVERLNQRLENQVRELQDDLDQALQASKERSDLLMREKDREVEKVKAQLTEHDAERRDLFDQLEAAKRDHASALEKLEDLNFRYQDFVQNEKQRNMELEERMKAKFQEETVVANSRASRASFEVAELRQALHVLGSTKESLIRQNDSLAASNSDLASKISELEQLLEEKESKLSSNVIELNSAASQVEDLREDLSRKSNELLSCQAAFESMQTQCSQLNQCLSKVVDESSKDRESLVNSLLAVQEELDESKKACSHLEKILQSMRRSVTDSETRYSQVRELLERERGNVQYILQSTEESRSELRDQLTSSTTKIASLESKLRKLEEDRTAMQAQTDELRKHNEAIKTELLMEKDFAQAAYDALSSEKQSLLASLSSERDRGDELVEKLRLANARIEEQQREHDFASGRLEEKIRLFVSEAESKKRMYEESLKSKEAELQALYGSKEELKSARSEVSRLSASLRRSKDEVNHLSATMDGLRQQQQSRLDQMLGSHRRELEIAAQEKQELERLLRRSNERLESLDAKLQAAEEGLATSRVERERLIAEKHDLVSVLQNAEQKVSQLRDELEAAQNSSVSSNDSDANEFSGLSKSDLKARCVEFREELNDLRQYVAESNSKASQRAEQTSRLQSDLNLMSTELDNLIKTNGMLESRLADLRSSNDKAEEAERLARSENERTKEHVKSLELRLLQESQKVDSLREKVSSLEFERASATEDRNGLADAHQSRILELEKLLLVSESGRRSALEDLSRKQSDLKVLKREFDGMRDKMVSLETQLTHDREELQSAIQEAELRQLEKASEIETHATQVSSLESECSTLRLSVAKLEAQLEEAKIELKCRAGNEELLSAAVEKARQELQEVDAMREDVVSKLSQASKVVTSQKSTIDALEKRSNEAEMSCNSLSKQILSLQDTIKELEGSTTSRAELSVSRIQELEQACVLLEKEKDNALKEAAILRDALRQAQQIADGTEKSTSSLQSRLSSIKTSLEQSKLELSDTQAALRESNALSRRLEGELESKRMEGDHYKAKIQLLNASVVRLQSDVMLYKEAALQAEFRLSGTESMDEEISRLKSEILAKNSKLLQLTEVYRSQEQVLALSQTLEEQLITFIEDLIQRVDDTCGEVSLQRPGSIVLRVNSQPELRALDLAGVDVRSSKSASSQGRTFYVNIIQTIIGELEAKRGQLCAWKKQRARRVLSIVTTPSTKHKGAVPETPEVVETLNNVKRVLNEHLSPIKQQGMNRLDVEYFQKVIHALERNIDSLLDDLQSANEALKAKDQLFTDLEHLASHREWERSRLEKKLESQNAILRDLEDKLKLQVSWKRAADKELATLRKKLDSLTRNSVGEGNSSSAMAKRTAGRLIASFVESRKKPAARTFCHRACQTPAPQVVERQQHAAAELSQQLDSTRQKLSLLKQQMRRRREPPLDCIVEGHESSI